MPPGGRTPFVTGITPFHEVSSAAHQGIRYSRQACVTTRKVFSKKLGPRSVIPGEAGA